MTDRWNLHAHAKCINLRETCIEGSRRSRRVAALQSERGAFLGGNINGRRRMGPCASLLENGTQNYSARRARPGTQTPLATMLVRHGSKVFAQFMFIVSPTTHAYCPSQPIVFPHRHPFSRAKFEPNFLIDSTGEDSRRRGRLRQRAARTTSAPRHGTALFKCKLASLRRTPRSDCFVQKGSSFPSRPVRYISCYLSAVLLACPDHFCPIFLYLPRCSTVRARSSLSFRFSLLLLCFHLRSP